jgi:hypothetical protein
MQDFDMIEMREFGLNHLIHHFEEYEDMDFEYDEEYECIKAATNCIEEILWN